MNLTSIKGASPGPGLEPGAKVKAARNASHGRDPRRPWKRSTRLGWAACALFTAPLPTARQDADGAVRELLANSHSLPEAREDAAWRIADWRSAALPALDQALASGSQAQARMSILALAALDREGGARASLARTLRDRDDPDLRILAALALSFCSGPETETLLLAGVREARASPLQRASCAIALGCTGLRSVREASLAALGEETDPLVAGAVAAAFGLCGEESAIGKIEERLARAREPTERAGLLLALAALDRRQAPAPADLASSDPVLPFAAALHFADEPTEEGAAAAWGKALGDPSLGAVLYAALGRGSEPRSRMRLTEAVRRELDPRVRAAVYGAAAARRELPLLLALRSDPEDRASIFCAAALLVRSSREAATVLGGALVPAALEAVADPASPAAQAAALFLACARVAEAVPALERWAAAGGAGAAVADLARKALRGDLDQRALAAQVRGHAFERGILLERSIADGMARFASYALGGGSEYFSRRQDRTAPVPRAWLAAGRPAAREAPVYEDFWLLLSRRPFDRALRRER